MLVLGAIAPNQNWQSVGAPISMQGLVLQFQSEGQWSDICSMLLVRRTWQYQGFKLVGSHERVYPSEESLMLPLATAPQDLYLSADSSAVEVMKIYQFKTQPYVEPNWSVVLLAIA